MIRPFRSALLLLSLALVSQSSPSAAFAQDPATENEEDKVVEREPQRISGAITTDPPREELRLIPPFSKDRAGDITTRAVFPFYFERRGPSLVERFVVPYYMRRSPQLNADVALGLVWSMRGPERNTVIVGPVYGHRKGDDWGAALLPLFSAGRYAGHSHLVIPPLLTWMDGDEKKHRRVVALYYDVKREHARWRGLAPLVWSKHGDAGGFTVLPPLFWRFTENDPFEAKTVVPPFYHVRTKDETKWALVPLLWRKQNPNLRATTIPFALFHHARGPEQFRLVTPLLAYLSDKRDGKLWITPFYQRKRGDKNFDAVAPLFIRTWDDRDMSRGLYLPPIYWHWEDPANTHTTVLPFFMYDRQEGISDSWLTPLIGRKRYHERDAQTWWTAPTFHYGWAPNEWFFNIHPFTYIGRKPDASHTVIAPLWFDFRNKKTQTHRFSLFPLYWDFKDFKKHKRSHVLFPLYYNFENRERQRHHRVGFPFYWDFDFQDREERYTVTFPFHGRGKVADRTRHYVLNTMYEPAHGKNRSWQFHLFPLFARGGSDNGKWWSLLYGLVGFDRRGENRRLQLFWLPIDLGKK